MRRHPIPVSLYTYCILEARIPHTKQQPTHRLLIVHVVTTRTPTPGPRSTTPALSPVVVARPALAGWWWSHKGVVDGDLLLEQLLPMSALDGCFGLIKRGIFDKSVALPSVNPIAALFAYMFSRHVP